MVHTDMGCMIHGSRAAGGDGFLSAREGIRGGEKRGKDAGGGMERRSSGGQG